MVCKVVVGCMTFVKVLVSSFGSESAARSLRASSYCREHGEEYSRGGASGEGGVANGPSFVGESNC